MLDTTTRDLDTTLVLESLVDARRTADLAEAHILALAVHYVDLHPVTDQAPAATWADRTFPVGNAAKTAETPLGGEGTQGVAEYAVEELAAALGVGYHTGLQLVCDAVELCYRLPKLWALVHDGRLQAWKARTVATETTRLSRDAAGFVDAQLASTARRNKLPGPGGIRALVRHALTRFDPAAAAALDQAEADRRGVWFDHRESTATTQLIATLDTVAAVGLDATITDLAATLGRLGDTTDLDIRRASALGMLADPQAALDLLTGPDPTTETGTDSRPGAAPTTAAVAATDQPTTTGWRPARPGMTLYVHVSAADLATGTGGAWIEKLGPITLDLLATWLRGTSNAGAASTDPGCGKLRGISVRPVLDMNADESVDAHDPPTVMRERVIIRDRHCVFPGCRVDARDCDLDHVKAYVPLDEGGPPGQTNAGNLACLCRRHHRLKTFTAWAYHRTPDGRYVWTSPHGATYLT